MVRSRHGYILKCQSNNKIRSHRIAAQLGHSIACLWREQARSRAAFEISYGEFTGLRNQPTIQVTQCWNSVRSGHVRSGQVVRGCQLERTQWSKKWRVPFGVQFSGWQGNTRCPPPFYSLLHTLHSILVIYPFFWGWASLPYNPLHPFPRALTARTVHFLSQWFNPEWLSSIIKFYCTWLYPLSQIFTFYYSRLKFSQSSILKVHYNHTCINTSFLIYIFLSFHYIHFQPAHSFSNFINSSTSIFKVHC